ncbi:MAG: hypothetical protein ACYC9O_07605 [Candidatus Latescibacterota bacterium]
MEKENVWGKIRKTVVDGVTIAAEKTEEYTKLGKAKIDVLAVKRKMTKKQTELGEIVYKGIKEGGAVSVMDTDLVREIIVEMGTLENELGEKQRVFDELRNKAESDVESVKEKAKSSVEGIKSKAKTKVDQMRKKGESKTEEVKTESGVEV